MLSPPIQKQVDTILAHCRGQRFAEAAAAARTLASDQVIPEDERREAARAIVASPAIQPIPATIEELQESHSAAQSMLTTLARVLEPNDPAMLRIRELSAQFELDPNARITQLKALLAERETKSGRYAADTLRLRGELALAYHAAGRAHDAQAVWRDTGICAHLKPVEDYLRAQGANVCHVGKPWSRNCHIWVTFERVVLDAESLIKRFSLPACVTVHTHRGTHDGSEHGLYCEEHQDAVIACYPQSGIRVIG